MDALFFSLAIEASDLVLGSSCLQKLTRCSTDGFGFSIYEGDAPNTSPEDIIPPPLPSERRNLFLHLKYLLEK